MLRAIAKTLVTVVLMETAIYAGKKAVKGFKEMKEAAQIIKDWKKEQDSKEEISEEKETTEE